MGLVESGRGRGKGGGRQRGSGQGAGFDLSNPANRRLLLLGGAVAAAAIAIGVVLATRGSDPEPVALPPPAVEVPPAVDPPVATPVPVPPTAVPPTQPDPPPPAPPPVTPDDLQAINPRGEPIQEGSTGERVRRVQVALSVFGFDPGPVDGQYGPATRDAISAFQRENNLEADGVAGRATLRAINRRIRNTA